MAAPLNNEDLKFLISVEAALYDDRDFEREEEADAHEIAYDLVYTMYKGAYSRTFSAPMFEIKDDHPVKATHPISCWRCDAETGWAMHHDQVIFVSHTVGYDGDQRVQRPVEFDPQFAARRSHP